MVSRFLSAEQKSPERIQRLLALQSDSQSVWDYIEMELIMVYPQLKCMSDE